MAPSDLSPRRNGMVLALLIFLLGQASLLLHDTAVSAHVGGVDCPLCLLAASGSAALPASVAIFPSLQAAASFEIAALPAAVVGRLLRHHSARAPPLSS